MKSKFFLWMFIFTLSLLTACQKNINNGAEKLPVQSAEQKVKVDNGVVTFPTSAIYLTVTENKGKEQERLFDMLNDAGFAALKQTQSTAAATTTAGNAGLASIVNTFDPDKYDSYLLSILNSDKICSINGYYVKVDLDNVFCTAVDQSVANAYSLLTSNAFLNNNPNVMLFTNANEPVIEVLSKIRTGVLTWASYQTQLGNAKGGQGICLKNGIDGKSDTKWAGSPLNTNLKIAAIARYLRGFISFTLYAEGFANGNGVSSNVNIRGAYEWQGVCKGAGSGSFMQGNYTWQERFTPYQGGSPLKTAAITCQTQTAAPYNVVTGYASIY